MSNFTSNHFHLLRQRPAFARLFCADILSQTGHNMLVVAFPVLILELTHDITLTGLAFSGELIAYAIISPLAGALADRVDQKPLMLLANLARSALLLTLLWCLGRGFPVALYLAISVLLGCASALFGPARAAFLRRLLHGEELIQAAALEGTAGFLLRLFGPALMGLLLLVGDVRLGVALDAALYLVSSAMLLPAWVSGPRVEAETQDEGAAQGWNFLWRHSGLRPLLVLDGVVCVLGLASWSTCAAFLETVLHVKAANTGWLQAAAGLGGALGTVLAARVPRGRATSGWILTGLTATYLCLSLVTTLPQMVVVWLGRGLVLGVLTLVLSQSLAREVPSHLMGRVQAAWEQMALMACFLGSVASPWLLRHLGAHGAFRLFGHVMLATCVAWWCAVAVASARARRAVSPYRS